MKAMNSDKIVREEDSHLAASIKMDSGGSISVNKAKSHDVGERHGFSKTLIKGKSKIGG